MSYYRNLLPGQWQAGDILMGYGTNIKLESVDVKPYDVNAQDYQIPRADEMRFGFDQFKPTTIELTMQVLHNRLLPGWESYLPNFWHSMPTIHDLAREWRFDEGRNIWGEMKPLFMCSKLDGIRKIIYGRPGQFTVTADDEFNKGEIVKVLAEFRRGDTFAYSQYENLISLTQAAPEVTIDGTGGQGPSWLRIEILGPVTHPILTFTNMFGTAAPVVMDLDYEIAADEIVEINAYPWSRRVVNNASPPLSLPANLIGGNPYLDRLRFNFDAQVDVSLAGSGMTSATEVLVLWRDVYTVI
jgi:hypothetical protein